MSNNPEPKYANGTMVKLVDKCYPGCVTQADRCFVKCMVHRGYYEAQHHHIHYHLSPRDGCTAIVDEDAIRPLFVKKDNHVQRVKDAAKTKA